VYKEPANPTYHAYTGQGEVLRLNQCLKRPNVTVYPVNLS
jgi:hypothetical protein